MKNLYENLTDEQLVELAKTEHDACDFLLRRYSCYVKRIARSFYLVGAENDDLIQEGMLGLYNAICTFDNSKAGFKTYCVMCIKNSIIDAIKSANRLKYSPLNNSVSYNQTSAQANNTFMIDLFTNGIDSAEIIAMQNEEYSNLLQYISAVLNKKELEILKYYLSGKPYREISDALDISTKKVDNTVQKIKKKLHNRAKKH